MVDGRKFSFELGIKKEGIGHGDTEERREK
jgi:hypothetical protein